MVIRMKSKVVKRILYFCEVKNLTIEQLAIKCNLDFKKLNNILFGKNKTIRIDTLLIICNGLNVSLVEFFDSDLFS